jgi:cobalt/nickel transport system ATP-binding protein
MIELDRVAFGWPEGHPVFDQFSLRVEAGEKLVLLGANGCGKSTLLKLLDGLVFATQGSYRYGGMEVTRTALRERGFARRFRQEVALLFQHPESMLFNPTVREEIAYTPRQLGLPAQDRVARWAAELGLGSLLDKPPHALSGGEKQKVALACLLAVEPVVLLLDEPTASLDPRAAAWLVDHLLTSSATAVVSTHNLSMAAELGFRALVLDEHGRILFDGPTADALADIDLLEAANLAHRHRHRHAGHEHVHAHRHDWEPPAT